MKKLNFYLLLCVLSLISISCNAQTGWTRLDEYQLIKMASETGKKAGLNEKQSMEFAICVLDKLKVKFPSPTVKDSTSLKTTTKLVAEECLKPYSPDKVWTSKFELNLRNELLKLKQIEVFNPKYRVQLCDCIISKLKQKFPNGLKKLEEVEAESIGRLCMKDIMKTIE